MNSSSPSDVLPGAEKWFRKQTAPGSAGRSFTWPTYNEVIHPPAEGVVRPAYVCHMRPMIRYNLKKLRRLSHIPVGLSVDDAIRQLDFTPKRGAHIIKEVIEEAVQMAVEEHNVEFATNLWVAESFASYGDVVKGARRHQRRGGVAMGEIRYQYSHYFCRLEEGKPPEHMESHKASKSPSEWLEWYVQRHREKTIPQDLG